MIKSVIFLTPLLFLCFGCTTFEQIIELNATCCQDVSYSFEESCKESEKTLLTVVLSTEDMHYYNDPSCLLFNLQEKEDKRYLDILNHDFSIVKLDYQAFENQVHDSLIYYDLAQELVDEALSNKRSFVFISTPSAPTVYGPTYLDDKEGVKDLLWVKFGP